MYDDMFIFLIRYDKAVDMLKRQTVILQKFTSRSHLYKANLSILILILAIGDDVEAGKQFNFMCGNDAGFAQSDEAGIAEDLLRAYDERDQGLLEKTVRLQHVSFLDNEVVKLARLLTVPGEVLSQNTGNNYNSPRGYQQRMPEQDYRNMSHAQARQELYSRPTSGGVDDLNKGFSNMKVSPQQQQPPPPAPYYEDDDDDEDGLR